MKPAGAAGSSAADEEAADEPLVASPEGRSQKEQRRLDHVLRALPIAELRSLIQRTRIPIDAKKRIDTAAQVARALVRLEELRNPSRLPVASAQLLRRLVEANGCLKVSSLPVGLDHLVRLGIVFACVVDDVVELLVPTAFLVQMPSWEGEDPRSLRALLAQAPFETASAIASHYLGRPSTPPVALSLEPAWEVLGDPAARAEELQRISHQEKRLLDQVERIGGEVDTQELMDLEREPMRVRGAYGVAAGRRGAAFSLEKRGLLFPVHPNRYVIPSEIAALIGHERKQQREERREQIRQHVMAEDHLPRRARFSTDPAPLALGLTLTLREMKTEVKPGVGTAKSLVSRLAQRLGRDTETTSLIIALTRALGLWDCAIGDSAPPGSLTVEAFSYALFDAWRRGGAWDEARVDAEMLRIAAEHRDASPVGVLREMVLEALQDLGEDQWVPYTALVDYLHDDPRTAGLERLFARWAARVGVTAPTLAEMAERVLLSSLPALGLVDLGGTDRDFDTVEDAPGLALRLTARGKRRINGTAPGAGLLKSELVEPLRLKLGTNVTVAEVLQLGSFTEVAATGNELCLDVTSKAVAHGISEGIEASVMREHLARITPLSEELSELLKQADAVVGRGTFAGASGFVWIEDAEARDLLRSSASTSELFLDPSPPGGLLVAPGVDAERLMRRCRALGVVLALEEGELHSQAQEPPPTIAKTERSDRARKKPRSSQTGRKMSWKPPETRSGSGGDRSTG